MIKMNVKVVGVGGGTGLSTLLTGLKGAVRGISAVVTVTDDGGSSGKIRKAFNMPPPGDIRNCLVALASVEPLMSKLFQYRFPGSQGFNGHPFGNLFIMAMTRITGSFEEGVRQASKILKVNGQVVPSTLSNVVLGAEYVDGEKIFGQTSITQRRKKISRIFLKPTRPAAGPDVIRIIKEADAVLLGPGSLYTSIIPNLLVRGVAEAVSHSKAVKVYISNIMTQPGETDGYSVSEHLQAVFDCLPGGIDYVLVNTGKVPSSVEKRYAEEGARAVKVDMNNLRKMKVEVVRKKMVSKKYPARHNPQRLAAAVLDIISRERRYP